MRIKGTRGSGGHWHQSSSALQLILCTRVEALADPVGCDPFARTNSDGGLVVNFALVHRKYSNELKLPRRYERWFMVWGARRPYKMIARSKSPVLFWNETVGGFDAEENWVLEREWFGMAGNRVESTDGKYPAMNVT